MSLVFVSDFADSTIHYGDEDDAVATSDEFSLELIEDPPAWEMSERVIPKLPLNEPRYAWLYCMACVRHLRASARSGLARYELRIKRGLSHEHICNLCNKCYDNLASNKTAKSPAYWTLYAYGKCSLGSACKLCHE